MSRFTEWSELDLRFDRADPSGRGWIVLAEIVWEANELGSGTVVRVPPGFRTDLASVPRPFWGLISPAGRHAQAAVLHDWMYHQIRDRRARGFRSGSYERRRFADRQFWLALRALGVGRATTVVMWAAVRLFGWPATRPR